MSKTNQQPHGAKPIKPSGTRSSSPQRARWPMTCLRRPLTWFSCPSLSTGEINEHVRCELVHLDRCAPAVVGRSPSPGSTMASGVVDVFFPFIFRGKAEADTLSQQPMPHQAAGERALMHGWDQSRCGVRGRVPDRKLIGCRGFGIKL